ncbi:MAG: hypothetical protein J5J06_09445 [Phycisphaerae bacterium]|nr:hypothetical protein [Phycisphaerae bacterium]
MKRLFAVSGNRCAFPKCSTPLIDPESGSVVGEICHIKGEKSGAARYDVAQSNVDRHGFDNLILFCNVHHKIVDDDEIAYTVDRLMGMKREHESRHFGSLPVEEATAERFVKLTINNFVSQATVITNQGQTGGQTAHTIHNYFGAPGTVEAVRLEAKLELAGDLQLMKAIGCPGMRLTVVCRSSRPARIRSAHFLIDGVNVMEGLQQGFGADFGYTPVEGSTQTLDVTLIPLTRPNSPEGYVLNLDDAARFLYPLPLQSTALALRVKSESLSIAVKFLDDTNQVVLAGEPIVDTLRGVHHLFQKTPGHLKVPVNISVRVSSTTPPGPEAADLIGKTNQNHVILTEPEDGTTES